ncbi:hypothetical protein BDK61_4393 [Haloarcula quadrata]|uniref:DUF7344 domain-containing protein n=1 Tax=Haloarcula quadrata TaxID=182779 RepID=A0A495QQU2_9EURY|nr:hypothetical protein BDK61_4393 [Haloarcula quadrata]
MVRTPMSNSEQRISTETTLQLLTKQERRQILRHVAEASDGTTVDKLTQHLRGLDSLQPDGNGPTRSWDSDLHHLHLPKLQEANVLEYDTNRGTVHRSREFQTVFSLLEVIDDHRKDTSLANS